MSKRPPGGPDSDIRGEIAGYRHAPQNAEYGVDAGGSDEGESRAAKRARGKAPSRRAARKSADDKLPTILYKDAGALKELSKMYLQSGPGTLIQIKIPAPYLQATFAEVKGRHVWGTDIYTDDSDIVCAVMHCGYYNASLKKPVASVAEMRAVIQILPPQMEYPVFVRNGIRSRAWWAGGTSCSYKVERCCLLSKNGTSLELPPRSDCTQESPASAGKALGVAMPNFRIFSQDAFSAGLSLTIETPHTVCQAQISHNNMRVQLIPTFTPANMERVMNTRGREASSERRQRQVKPVASTMRERQGQTATEAVPTVLQEMTVMYNLSNEPWPKYNMAAIADHGLKPSQWTSARFQTQVLLVETVRTRYEVSASSDTDMESAEGQGEVLYRFARCKQPLAMRVMYNCGLPLPESHVDVLEPKLRWEQLKWSEEGVDVKDKHYRLVRLHFIDKAVSQSDSPSVSMEGTGEGMGDTGNVLLNGSV